MLFGVVLDHNADRARLPIMVQNYGMGSRIYDFLSDSFLFQNHFLESAGDAILSEVQKELQRYREFCLLNECEIYEDATGEQSSLTLYSAENIEVRDLVQAALYWKAALKRPVASVRSCLGK